MAKLYKGGGASSASNSKKSRKSGGLAVPFQPVRGGAKVLGSKTVGRSSKSGKFKLRIKTDK